MSEQVPCGCQGDCRTDAGAPVTISGRTRRFTQSQSRCNIGTKNGGEILRATDGSAVVSLRGTQCIMLTGPVMRISIGISTYGGGP